LFFKNKRLAVRLANKCCSMTFSSSSLPTPRTGYAELASVSTRTFVNYFARRPGFVCGALCGM
jgi:hypothetical protein